jgi:hypothetical protein
VRIGLCQVDGKWPNLALMKLSTWHKQQGDSVELFTPLRGYDVVYASKVFDFTPDSHYLPEHTTKGGTGYSLTNHLYPLVERCMPDYSLYPEWKAAIGFTTRGCVRQCPFCVVPRKEGKIRVVADVESFWCGQREIVLLDNNLTAAPWYHFERTMLQLRQTGAKVDFSQGLDLRLITDAHAELLAKVRLMKQIHFAWDNVSEEAAIRRGLDVLKAHMPLSRVMLYVLIGYNSTPDEDMHRVMTLRGLGVDPFVMAYNKRDLYQRRFARWVNHKAIFKTVEWAQYGVRAEVGR